MSWLQQHTCMHLRTAACSWNCALIYPLAVSTNKHVPSHTHLTIMYCMQHANELYNIVSDQGNGYTMHRVQDCTTPMQIWLYTSYEKGDSLYSPYCSELCKSCSTFHIAQLCNGMHLICGQLLPRTLYTNS